MKFRGGSGSSGSSSIVGELWADLEPNILKRRNVISKITEYERRLEVGGGSFEYSDIMVVCVFYISSNSTLGCCWVILEKLNTIEANPPTGNSLKYA